MRNQCFEVSKNKVSKYLSFEDLEYQGFEVSRNQRLRFIEIRFQVFEVS
jgi:hypothetical protein